MRLYLKGEFSKTERLEARKNMANFISHFVRRRCNDTIYKMSSHLSLSPSLSFSLSLSLFISLPPPSLSLSLSLSLPSLSLRLCLSRSLSLSLSHSLSFLNSPSMYLFNCSLLTHSLSFYFSHTQTLSFTLFLLLTH